MRLAPLLAASVVAIGLTAAASTPQAATLAPLKGVGTNQSLVTKAGYGRYCWRWRHICARRWGWGNWRHRRCMINHGC
ncbi:MAG: glycosyl hydrolase family 5 [Proteobacteria bacterium]|nr:glycosyl hydrolase family 5 [Pseudomonadota bacterium]